MPVIDLGQCTAFAPQSWVLHWSWTLIGGGWGLTIALVAGLTGILKRD